MVSGHIEDNTENFIIFFKNNIKWNTLRYIYYVCFNKYVQ